MTRTFAAKAFAALSLALALSLLLPDLAFAAEGGVRAFIVHNMAPIMFGALVLFLLLGYPVAFALAANGLIFGLIGIETRPIPAGLPQALPERVYGTMNNEVLHARCPSSPSWASSSNAPAWRKTCWIRSGRCSAPSAAALLMR